MKIEVSVSASRAQINIRFLQIGLKKMFSSLISKVFEAHLTIRLSYRKYEGHVNILELTEEEEGYSGIMFGIIFFIFFFI